MKAEELIYKMNVDYGTGPRPKTLEVDLETYANCCQWAFNKADILSQLSDCKCIDVLVGLNNGLMFKGVELILISSNQQS